MKVHYCSDPHIDMWFPFAKIDNKRINILFNSNLPLEKEEVLVIAGDLGHSNTQNKDFLILLQKHYFENIIFVLGNHDYWLFPDNDAKVFKTTKERIEDMREWAKGQHNIHCLNGDIIEIDGVKFGGCDSWYDGSYYYLHHYSPYSHSLETFWKTWMNDYEYVSWDGWQNSFYDLFSIEKEKIKAVYQKCDVMITHVSPSIASEHLNPKDIDNKICSFYCFDGAEYVEKGTMTHWIYGHSHEVKEFILADKKVCTNAIGYIDQNMKIGLKFFEINKKGKITI